MLHFFRCPQSQAHTKGPLNLSNVNLEVKVKTKVSLNYDITIGEVERPASSRTSDLTMYISPVRMSTSTSVMATPQML